MVDFSKLLTEEEKQEIAERELYEKSLPRRKIIGRFVSVTGKWDSKKDEYVDIQRKPYSKELEMVIKDGHLGKVLKFEGGPTGYESFYIRGFLENSENSEFEDLCICAGTINRWDECMVSLKEVRQFVLEHVS